MTPKRKLEAEGELDYDYPNDILFFKAKNREYDRSIELDRFVIDIDSQDYIVGIQIFDASDFLRIPKIALQNVRRWKFQAEVEENRLEVRFVLQGTLRNKIIERSPIIIKALDEHLPDSRLICTVR